MGWLYGDKKKERDEKVITTQIVAKHLSNNTKIIKSMLPIWVYCFNGTSIFLAWNKSDPFSSSFSLVPSIYPVKFFETDHLKLFPPESLPCRVLFIHGNGKLGRFFFSNKVILAWSYYLSKRLIVAYALAYRIRFQV